MNVTELPDELDRVAGPTHDFTEAGLADVHRRVRRRRKAMVGAGTVATVAAVAFVAVIWWPSGSDSLRVASVPETTTVAPSLQPVPGRTAVALPDDSVGWVEASALRAPLDDVTSPDDANARLDRWEHTLIPVSKLPDRDSRLIGYYLPNNFGFLPLSTTTASGFTVDGAIAHGRCMQPHTFLTIEDGEYQCTAIDANAEPLGAPLIPTATTTPSATASADGGDTFDVAKAWDQLRQSGRVGVVDHQGNVRGTIPFDVVNGVDGYSAYPNRLAPVLDSNGNVTGFFGQQIGFIEREEAESPDFDLQEYIATHNPPPSPEELAKLRAEAGLPPADAP